MQWGAGRIDKVLKDQRLSMTLTYLLKKAQLPSSHTLHRDKLCLRLIQILRPRKQMYHSVLTKTLLEKGCLQTQQALPTTHGRSTRMMQLVTTPHRDHDAPVSCEGILNHTACGSWASKHHLTQLWFLGSPIVPSQSCGHGRPEGH